MLLKKQYDVENGGVLDVIRIVITLLMIAIQISMLFWVFKMEQINCLCSKDYKRDILKFALIVSIPINIIINIWVLFADFEINNVLYTGLAMSSLFMFVNLFTSVYYLYYLRNSNCECSEDIIRDIYYWSNFIAVLYIVAIIILLILMGILFGSRIFTSTNSKNIKKK